MLPLSLLSLLLPGSAHLLLKRYREGLLLIVCAVAGGLGTALHLFRGLGAFESPLGSFLFGALLRALPVFWGFALVDAGLSAEQAGNRRLRRAVACNLVIPGSGHLLCGSLRRGLMSLGLLALIITFTSARYHRHADILLLAMQLLTAFAILGELRQREQQEREQQGSRSPASAQPASPTIGLVLPAIALVFVSAAVGFAGYVVSLRMPDYSFSDVTAEQVRVRSNDHGIAIKVPQLGISLLAAGDQWVPQEASGGALFTANHAKQIELRLGTEAILPFVKPNRHIDGLRQRISARGFQHVKSKTLALGERQATQMHFSRDIGQGQTLDQWTIALPEKNYIVLLLIQCNRIRCQEALEELERTKDSLRLQPAAKKS